MPNTTLSHLRIVPSVSATNPDSAGAGPNESDTAIAHLPGCRRARSPLTEICPQCLPQYKVCERCGLGSVSLRDTDDDYKVCGHCADTHFWECADCDNLISGGDYCRSCDRSCDCGNCYECGYSDSDDLIHDYDYKPAPIFHGEGTTFLGLELEINANSRRADAEIATDHLGDMAYLKADSSIDYGFEVVTHPMSYDWAMANFPWKMLDALQEAGCDAGGNTGLHVHISRAGFTGPAHIFRWMKFLYRNQDMVIAVARRNSYVFAEFDTEDRERVKEFAKGGRSERYRAINTQNEHTFELRVFASSLNTQQVKAALGLAAASVEFTRQLTTAHIVHHGGWQWSAFTTWLGDEPQYAPLKAELEVLECAC